MDLSEKGPLGQRRKRSRELRVGLRRWVGDHSRQRAEPEEQHREVELGHNKFRGQYQRCVGGRGAQVLQGAPGNDDGSEVPEGFQRRAAVF